MPRISFFLHVVSVLRAVAGKTRTSTSLSEVVIYGDFIILSIAICSSTII